MNYKYIIGIIGVVILADIYIMFSPNDEKPKIKNNEIIETTIKNNDNLYTEIKKENEKKETIKKVPIQKPIIEKKELNEKFNNNTDNDNNLENNNNNKQEKKQKVKPKQHNKTQKFVSPFQKKQITKAIHNGDLTPLYNEWKTTKNGEKYNIFVTTNPAPQEQNQFAPPTMPKIIQTKIGDTKINAVIAPNSEAYIAIKNKNEDDDNNQNTEYKPLQEDNKLIAPPAIGE